MFFKPIKDKLELGKQIVFGRPSLFVTPKERNTHTYVIGITGMGKSKFLEHLLFQDVIEGRGCGVLDPHSDLVDDLFRYLLSHHKKTSNHWKRIVYFDPSRLDYLLPFNVLDSGFNPYETAQNVVEAFRRTWPKALAEAPRFANIATASILTLIANKLTLIEMPKLLTDKSFRHRLLANIDDEELLSFWNGRFEQWGKDAPLMVESILNKVTAFTMNPQLKLILGAKENRLNFRQIMDEEKILIVDLGRCDGETRRLIGSLVVTGLEQAARSRKEIESAKRKPFYFCIDEFQDFCSNDGAAQTLAQILSECRKFGLHLTLAHQTLAQINERMKGALGNIQLKVVFGVSRPDAEILSKHLFTVDNHLVKHEVNDSVQQEKSHPLYYSIVEEWENHIQSLQSLTSRHAIVKRPHSIALSKIKTVSIQYKQDIENHLHTTKQQLVKIDSMPYGIIQEQIASRVPIYPPPSKKNNLREVIKKL